jgi:hypothetical protein
MAYLAKLKRYAYLNDRKVKILIRRNTRNHFETTESKITWESYDRISKQWQILFNFLLY